MTRLKMERGILDLLVEDIVRHGRETVEAGAFLLAPEVTSNVIDTIAFPTRQGATRRRDLFVVSSEAMLDLFQKAEDLRLVVRAQVHSHRKGAFLSWTDLEHGFSVDGFVTSVVPNYSKPPRNPNDWGWWKFENDEWNKCESPEVVDGDGHRIEFEAG